jgi:uncharacterized protein (DUF1330 family)
MTMPEIGEAASIEATEAQLEALRTGDPAEPLALIHFHRVRDDDAYAAYCGVLDQAVQASGGRHVYQGRVDQVIVPNGVVYHRHRIDAFPSRELAAESMRSPNPHAKEALEDAFVMAALPLSPWFRLATRVAAVLLRTLGGRRVAMAPPFPGEADSLHLFGASHPEIEGPLASAARFLEADQTVGFAMVNLNLPRERAEYAGAGGREATGAEAYERYGRVVAPMVFRRGGRFLFFGTPDGVVIGDPRHPLAKAWTQYVLVYYPSRVHMRDMLTTDEYGAATLHRQAGLAAASLMPTTPDSGFSP